MSCDGMSYAKTMEQAKPKLAVAGWSPERIANLEAEVQLAREKAKATSYGNGETLSQQQQAVKFAEAEAIRIAHEEMHAQLEADMVQIKALGDAKVMVYGEPARSHGHMAHHGKQS